MSWGLTVEEASGPPVEVWPDNLQSINVFIKMSTQWRVAYGGATGLDYTALQHVLRMSAVPRDEWPDVFECVRVMEDAALTLMRAKK